jgi:hypothetical protein
MAEAKSNRARHTGTMKMKRPTGWKVRGNPFLLRLGTGGFCTDHRNELISNLNRHTNVLGLKRQTRRKTCSFTSDWILPYESRKGIYFVIRQNGFFNSECITIDME